MISNITLTTAAEQMAAIIANILVQLVDLQTTDKIPGFSWLTMDGRF